MTLLREIQSSCTDPSVDISMLLRKCMILASRLRSSEMKRWINNELNGYESTEELPNYRIFESEVRGDFIRSLGGGFRGIPIPKAIIDKEYHELLFDCYLMQPIGAYSDALIDKNEASPREMWPADAVALFARKLFKGLVMVQAWKTIPRSLLVGITEQIRTKILSFMLELEQISENIGEENLTSEQKDIKEISKSFTTNIYGNVQNLAIDCNRIIQVNTQDISLGNFDLLKDYLSRIGIKEDDIKDLQSAIKKDGKDKTTFGKNVRQWLKNLTIQITDTIIINNLSTALAKYFGLF